MNSWLSTLHRWMRPPTPPRLPVVRLWVTPRYKGAFTAPSPNLSAQLRDDRGQLVGRASYALSPLSDRWYVYDLNVEEGERGRGYGLAFLAQLATIHAVPITPVQEMHDAQAFWRKARSRRVPGLSVTKNLSVNQMNAENRRWQHLQPQADLLEREILQRILDGESWESATSRGASWGSRSFRAD